MMGGARKSGEGDWELDDLQGRRTPHPKDYAFLAVALPAPDLTVAPGSTLLLSCGASRTSLVRGSVSWIHMYPMKPEVKLLSLYVSEHAQLREMWVMGTLGGKVVLLLPKATAQDADWLLPRPVRGTLYYASPQLTVVSWPSLAFFGCRGITLVSALTGWHH